LGGSFHFQEKHMVRFPNSQNCPDQLGPIRRLRHANYRAQFCLRSNAQSRRLPWRRTSTDQQEKLVASFSRRLTHAVEANCRPASCCDSLNCPAVHRSLGRYCRAEPSDNAIAAIVRLHTGELCCVAQEIRSSSNDPDMAKKFHWSNPGM